MMCLVVVIARSTADQQFPHPRFASTCDQNSIHAPYFIIDLLLRSGRQSRLACHHSSQYRTSGSSSASSRSGLSVPWLSMNRLSTISRHFINTWIAGLSALVLHAAPAGWYRLSAFQHVLGICRRYLIAVFWFLRQHLGIRHQYFDGSRTSHTEPPIFINCNDRFAFTLTLLQWCHQYLICIGF